MATLPIDRYVTPPCQRMLDDMAMRRMGARHPHQHPVRAPVPGKVDAEHRSGQPYICPLIPIPSAVMRSA